MPLARGFCLKNTTFKEKEAIMGFSTQNQHHFVLQPLCKAQALSPNVFHDGIMFVTSQGFRMWSHAIYLNLTSPLPIIILFLSLCRTSVT